MSLILPAPGPKYNQNDEAQTRAEMTREDARNFKKGADVDIGAASLILTSSGGVRWAVVVDDAGALSTVAA